MGNFVEERSVKDLIEQEQDFRLISRFGHQVREICCTKEGILEHDKNGVRNFDTTQRNDFQGKLMDDKSRGPKSKLFERQLYEQAVKESSRKDKVDEKVEWQTTCQCDFKTDFVRAAEDYTNVMIKKGLIKIIDHPVTIHNHSHVKDNVEKLFHKDTAFSIPIYHYNKSEDIMDEPSTPTRRNKSVHMDDMFEIEVWDIKIASSSSVGRFDKSGESQKDVENRLFDDQQDRRSPNAGEAGHTPRRSPRNKRISDLFSPAQGEPFRIPDLSSVSRNSDAFNLRLSLGDMSEQPLEEVLEVRRETMETVEGPKVQIEEKREMQKDAQKVAVEDVMKVEAEFEQLKETEMNKEARGDWKDPQIEVLNQEDSV
ncbi:hypothetical protein ROZALSC1DRAFT_23833, partial [Rozella allomycis CSF55]